MGDQEDPQYGSCEEPGWLTTQRLGVWRLTGIWKMKVVQCEKEMQRELVSERQGR